MSQIQAPKVAQYVVTGPNSNEISASKVVMYLILEPGDIDPGVAATRQGHVQSQILRRR